MGVTVEPTIHLKEGPQGKNFTNQKLLHNSFKGRDLSHADFRGASVVGCDFTDADLSYAKFEGANCWEANFTNARLYRTNFKDAILARSIMKPKDAFGMTLTLTCDTVDKMQIDSKWQRAWLFLGLLMDAPDKELENTIISSIGMERYLKLREIFENRVI